MTGLPGVTLNEAQGFSASPADLDRLAVVLTSAASAGSGFSPFFLSGAAAVAALGYGDGVDTLAQIIEQRQANGNSGIKFPAALYGMPQSTPGSCGTIDISSVVGTCRPAVDATVLPWGTFRGAIRIMDDGNGGNGTSIGSPGITYQWALDEVPTWSPTKALGADDTITIPNSGVKFDLNASSSELTTLYTKLNLLRTKALAHFLITSGSPAVHAAADTTDNTALTAIATATTPATAVTLFNGILSLIGVHGASTTYHTTADTALATALAAIAAAVTVEDVDLHINALISAYSAHIALVGGGPVHGTADGTNTITAYTPVPGTLKTGDTWFVRTLAPAPSTGDIDTAATSLAKAPGDFALLVCEFPVSAANIAHVTSLLNTLRDVGGKRVTALCRTRPRLFDLNLTIAGVTNANPAVVTVASTASLTSGNTYTIAGVGGATGVNGNRVVTVIDGTTFSVPVAAGGAYTSGGTVTENDAAWNVNVAADLNTYNDDRIVVRAAYGLITDAMTTRQYLRSTLAQLAADTVRVERYEMPAMPADQAESSVTLVDATGTLVGHDEGTRGSSTGLSDDALGNRFSCEFRIPDPVRREAVFNTVPWTLYSATSKIKSLPVRRVANAMEREAISAGIAGLGGITDYIPADPNVPGSLPTLTEATRNKIHGVIFNALSSKFADDIQNADDGDLDAGLVQVASTCTVSGGNLVKVSVTLAPLVHGVLLTLALTLAIQE